MKRAPAGGLILAVVLITALGVAGTMLPVRPCGSCDALATRRLQLPNPPAHYRLDCPDCSDGGKVSLWRAWRPRVAKPIARILRELKNPATANLTPLLRPMLGLEGMDLDAYAHFLATEGWIGRPRFANVEGTPYLVLLARYSSSIMPGDSSAGVFLLHPEGRALDCFKMTCSNRLAELSATFLDPPGIDGAHVAVIPSPGSFFKEVVPTISYRLDQWRQPLREGKVPGKGAPETGGICRLRIRADRIEILTPAAK